MAFLPIWDGNDLLGRQQHQLRDRVLRRARLLRHFLRRLWLSRCQRRSDRSPGWLGDFLPDTMLLWTPGSFAADLHRHLPESYPDSIWNSNPDSDTTVRHHSGRIHLLLEP